VAQTQHYTQFRQKLTFPCGGIVIFLKRQFQATTDQSVLLTNGAGLQILTLARLTPCLGSQFRWFS